MNTREMVTLGAGFVFGVGTAALGWYWQRDQLAVPVVVVSVYAELCVCVYVCVFVCRWTVCRLLFFFSVLLLLFLMNSNCSIYSWLGQGVWKL